MTSLSSRPERFLDPQVLAALEAFASANEGAPGRTYAIGDIHGCADRLLALLARIGEATPREAARLLFLGDLVDRGPASAQVVAIVRTLEELSAPGAVVCLMGNHERMMLDWIESGDDLWIANGGLATIESFAAAEAPFPDDVVAWIAGLATWREDDAHIYVHAGLRPGLPYDRQSDEDRLWIREPFLNGEHDFGKHVVHGHTPRLDGPDRRRFRTNVDTGAVYGGALTAAALDPARAAPVGFLQA